MTVDVRQWDWEMSGGMHELYGKVDLCLADPPYNIGVSYDDDPTRDKMSDSEYESRVVQPALIEMSSLLRPGGVGAWVCPASHFKMVTLALDLTELEQPYGGPVIWYETFAQYQQRRLTCDYRLIFLLRKGPGEMTFNPDDIREESERQRMGDKRADPRGRVPGMVWRIRRLQGTASARRDWHPAQLPPELLRRLVQGWSRPDDLVLDMYAGSGSAGQVCRQLGRRAILVDRSSTYVQRMREEFA